ncbi:MAG: SpoIIIAH-like family protein [Clostridia bacterium]|nr:SpoIIIAH-like family protein [Clostridia bacterium]
MFMVIKKKHISFATICILCITLLFVHNLTDNNKNVETKSVYEPEDAPDNGEAIAVSSQYDEYCTEAKTNRDITRSKTCELLKNTIDNENTSQEAKKNAENQLIKLAKDMDDEIRCESLLAAKGLNNCVVFISDSSVTVTVEKKDFSSEDAAKINDIIFEQTGNNNIKIVEVK